MKKILLFNLTVLAALSLFGSEKFVLQDGAEKFTASFKGKPLIVNEGFTPGWKIERRHAEKAGQDHIFNAWGSAKKFFFWRREVSSKKNAQELEISFQVPVRAFNDEVHQGAIHYYFDVPLELLNGASYTVVSGRGKRITAAKGKISDRIKNGALIRGSVRQMAFVKKDLKLVFDLNPLGVQDIYSNYTVGSVSGMWHVSRVGSCIRFAVGTNSSRNGGLHTSKAVIYEGTIKDNPLRHAQKSYSYMSELPVEKQFVFGADKFGKSKIKAGTIPYSRKRSFGWVGKNSIKAEKFYKQGALYGAVSGNTPAMFQVDLKRSGLYLVTLNISAKEPVGAMDVSLNGRTLAEKLNIPSNTVQNIHVPMWIENGKAEFNFSGKWSLSQIGMQLLLASEEDYSFRRGFWRSRIKDNTADLYRSEHYAEEPEYKVALSSYPLPDPEQKFTGKPRMPEITTGYGELGRKQDTLFAAMIGSWGTGNAGTFTEFAMPGAVERNVKELKANGINVIMFNGMLARHTFAEPHKERLHKVIGNYIKAARDDKNLFIDHIDYSMLWNTDSGFRHLVTWTDRLQQTIDGSVPSRGRCMTNPIGINEFHNTIMKHIQRTGLDGLMVDECVYMGPTFCGCSVCRKTFTRDTGWVLPADELSPELHNNRSVLWRAWEEWRRRKVGEFWVGLRRKIAEYKKDFIFIGYTTHYGLTSDWATNHLAGDIFNYARAWDVVGTEIMPRNIFANARAVNSMRKTFSLFGRNGQRPVMGLVYVRSPEDWKIRYFGWAVNNLNAQQTWETRFWPCPEGEVDYHKFSVEKGNMDLRIARSSARVALLFSETSRNLSGSLPAAGTYRNEMLGTSQILSSLHIDHDVISEADLNPERLKKYSLLILGNSPYLSDQSLAEIKRYAENGGTVAASYMTGIADEYGNLRKIDLIGSWLGAPPNRMPLRIGKTFYVSPDGGKLQEVKTPFYARLLTGKQQAVGKALFANRNGVSRPAVLTAQVGKGKLIYYPGTYGAANCINELMVGKKYKFVKDPAMDALQKNLLSDLAGEYRTWTPVGLPENIFTASYYQDKKMVLHFLNATNWELPAGSVIEFGIRKNPFPPVKDIVFEVPRQVTSAYAVSPDFEGKKVLKTAKTAKGTRITLPGELLKIYTLVYVE